MNILGVRIDKVNMNEAVEKAKKCLEEEKLHMIFTPNPEMIISQTCREPAHLLAFLTL